VINFRSKFRTNSDILVLTETYSEELACSKSGTCPSKEWLKLPIVSWRCPIFMSSRLTYCKYAHGCAMQVQIKRITSFTSFTCCRVRACSRMGKELCLRLFCVTSRTVITRKDSEFYFVGQSSSFGLRRFGGTRFLHPQS
jgi:hypothetical protein